MIENKLKIGFVGTMCSGKTTATLFIAAELKERYGVQASALSNVDKGCIVYHTSLFPKHLEMYYWMISDIIRQEMSCLLSPNTDVLLVDNTPVSYMGYILQDYTEDTFERQALLDVCKAWARTYDILYFLEPMPYQEDGVRPSDNYRMQAYHKMVSALEAEKFSNLKRIPREEIVLDIAKSVNI